MNVFVSIAHCSFAANSTTAVNRDGSVTAAMLHVAIVKSGIGTHKQIIKYNKEIIIMREESLLNRLH